MRILQLSDIHLSNNNLDDLRNYYIIALINDLHYFHKDQPIDVVLITGDLVDRGGHSLGDDPYAVFEQEFITPLCTALQLKHSQVFFVPGNHDIDVKQVDEENEFFLSSKLTKELANDKLKEQEATFTKATQRVKQFKNFEQQFHSQNENYRFTLNESAAIVETSEGKVGFALINDAWRCSPSLTQEQHFIGSNQLFNAKRFLDNKSPVVTIAVFHHPLEMLNPNEGEEIENILHTHKYDIAFFGHNHRHKYESVLSASGGLVSINGRSAFNNAKESQSRYQPGYLLLDLHLSSKSYTLFARKYISSGYRFDKDVESYPNGQTSGKLHEIYYFPLTSQNRPHEGDLPNGYSADVNRVVKLLIGRSLYPNQFIFVRELIQNSVDACNRIQEKYSHLTPEIRVFINTDENSFEIIDEGDGMSKKVIREHFSIIGKSISQELGDTVHNVNLISQFGIGFISTFIVSEKVYVRTKSEVDGLINFEIDDVFKGFSYSSAPDVDSFQKQSTGTSIKVFLKQRYSSLQLLPFAKQYCRHIPNLTFYLNGDLHRYEASWNLENGVFLFNIKKSKYECKLTIGPNYRPLIASNSGFLINTYAPQLLPFKFPFIIGGEVVFEPRAIDFDLSRTNIMETEKAIEFRRDISIAVRVLFREVIENQHPQVLTLVTNYLQYYLTYYDNNQSKMAESYTDFYSKKELIDLCANLLMFDFKGSSWSLSEILTNLKSNGINRIYFTPTEPHGELDTIVYGYLYSKGNFIFKPGNVTVQFRDGATNFSIFQVLQIIGNEYGFELVNMQTISSDQMSKMKVIKQGLPPKVITCIHRIQQTNRMEIGIAHLGTRYKSTIRFDNEYLINYDHHSFQDLLKQIEQYTEDMLEVYFLGLFGLDLSLYSRLKESKDQS